MLNRLAVTFIGLGCLFTVVLGSSRAQAESSQASVKAAYIYNFTKFVKWPDNSFQNDKNTFIIGVIGNSDLSRSLQALEGERTGGRRIHVLPVVTPTDCQPCHVLVVNTGHRERWAEVFQFTRGKDVLVLGDEDGFTRAGGMLSFFLEKDRVRFEINLKAVQGSRLSISSRLLNLARIQD